MKQIDPNKVGDVVNIYDDWENELSLMGSAKLREFHKTGRSFILKETLPEIEQVVHNYNEWLVDWIMVDYKLVTTKPFKFARPVKIRYIDAIGITNSMK